MTSPGRVSSHDRMDFDGVGGAVCSCGWTGPDSEAQAHLLAVIPAPASGRSPSPGGAR